ncbi:PLP-dependent aminotransferase family protein [Paenibacillus lupini]|uniref:MocR-like pyridoxine biosynthesis transcription factor PdxR n=1 Tax=Paenibacillus lupini TaxID=1450204 RepID=UPI0014222675|nr:PLP-dependent aminotransferase family protein [Paenibacillus lupini]NIK21970.1 GntR family transcriptional regulator/MocR family aminotransferase [Paenibacillus lupini]
MPLHPKPNISATKTKHIYTLLRDRLFQGLYTSGSRLPSTRDLASEFGVSRALIVEVYEQLIAEGYLEGRQGSGTYVVDLGRRNSFSTQSHVSEAFESSKSAEYPNRFDGIDFRPSFPALEHIPRKKWKETALGVYESAHSWDFGYDDPAGNIELRTSICQLLLHTKGIQCAPSQVIVTAGATQAIALLCKLLLKPNDAIVTEDPTATFIHYIFASTGANIIPVTVDDHGLNVDNLPTHLHPKCIFVTPSHQFPFGSILSIGRRLQLLDYARQTGCYIIEDDYDSEFRYAGMPLHALRELDSERVIYVGTFSKNMFPALRLGYMVVPHELVSPLLQLKRVTDMHCPTLSQVILARFIASHHLERHISHMKRIYGKRRNRLIASLSETFGNQVKISGDAAGLHLIAELCGHRFDSLLTSQLEERNIKIYPAEKYSIVKGKFEDRLIMGFGNVTEPQIDQGIKTIAEILRS